MSDGGAKPAPILLKFGIWVCFYLHHRWVKGHNATQKIFNFETHYGKHVTNTSYVDVDIFYIDLIM